MTDSRAALVGTIIEQWRQKQGLHRAEKSLTLQIKAICRRFCDGDKKDADKLYRALDGKGEHPATVMALAAVMPLVEARGVVEIPRKATEKILCRLAGESPLALFETETRGVALLAVASVIGEVGDFSKYPKDGKAKTGPGCVWKRMGLAPYDGKAASTWRTKSGLSAEAWIELGYSPSRRSVAYNLASGVIKHQVRIVKDADGKDTGERKTLGSYGELYLARKAYENEHHPDLTPKHRDMRAQRYLAKRLLRDMWRAWRAAE